MDRKSEGWARTVEFPHPRDTVASRLGRYLAARRRVGPSSA